MQLLAMQIIKIIAAKWCLLDFWEGQSTNLRRDSCPQTSVATYLLYLQSSTLDVD